MSDRQEKTRELIQHLAAEFIGAEANKSPLITVTNTRLSADGKNVVVLVTVFPDSGEGAAINFLKRKRGEFKDFLKFRARLQRLPSIDFDIDRGEKSRQHIDTLI